MRMKQWRLPFAVSSVALCAFVSLPAQAELDGGSDTVAADRAHLAAGAITVHEHGAYRVHEMTLPNGTLVREYQSAAGTVFAVTWSGRGIPDLTRLLGRHYAAFDTSPHRVRGGLGHLVVRDDAQNPNLVVESNGRSPHFFGRAFLLKNLPEGVSVDDITY